MPSRATMPSQEMTPMVRRETTRTAMKRTLARSWATPGSLAATLLLGAVACGAEPQTSPADGPAATLAADLPPDAGFEALEAALAEGPPVRITFDITAGGAATVDLTGSLTLGEAGRVRLEATGEFVEAPVDVVLISDGERLFWTGSPFEEGKPTPAALREALAIGFTRMGILHNLARLSVGQAPDHEDGGVRDWVKVEETEERGVLDGSTEAAAARSVVRSITVAGNPAGVFALELEGAVPRIRRQEVAFPQGIMRVVERYPRVEFPAELPPGTFDTTPLDMAR